MIFPVKRLGGEAHYIAMSAKPVFSATGQFRGYRGTGRDITERPGGDDLEVTL